MYLNSSYPNTDFSKLKDKTILITGASGLIGIHLLSSLSLVREKYNIVIYTWTMGKQKNPLFDGCHKIVGDITDMSMYKSLPKFDCIIHSSGYGQPTKFLSNKIKTIEINTSSTIRLFELLKEDGTFLFISSSEVYNGLFKYNITEDEIGITNTQHPRAAYIEGKKAGEVICDVYREKGMNVKIARLSIAYGPGTKIGDTRVINSLIDKGLYEDVIELRDDGSSLRTFCYIHDVVEMLWDVMLDGTQFIYNIGGTETITILDLAKKIGYILDKEVVTPKTNNGLVGNPRLVNLSIERYNNEFGEKIFTPIDMGLKKTIEWQKNIK